MTAHRFSFESRTAAENAEQLPSLDRIPVPAHAHLVPVTEVALEAAAPNAIYLPQPYEPNYAYPLVVWLQPTGCRLMPLNQMMPVLSERNYVGTISRLALSIPNLNSGFQLQNAAVPGIAPWNWLQEVRRDVLNARRQAHVHSERIYLAGTGLGATAAIQVLLSKPEWFAGAIALDPMISTDEISLREFRNLAGKRVFVSSKVKNPGLAELGQLCHAAGMDFVQKVYRTPQAIHRRVLLDVDSWMMSSICQYQYV